MSHLLDSNIGSAHFRRPGGLAHRFIQYGGGLFVPTVVLGELYAGAYHLGNPAPLLQKITDLLDDVQVLDFDHDCARQFKRWNVPFKRIVNASPLILLTGIARSDLLDNQAA